MDSRNSEENDQFEFNTDYLNSNSPKNTNKKQHLKNGRSRQFIGWLQKQPIVSRFSPKLHRNRLKRGNNNMDAIKRACGHHQGEKKSETLEFSLQIDDYAIMETIGHGSFGKVKAGFNLITGEKVALKVLSRQKMRAMDVVAKIKREITLLAKLNHRHVIKLYKVISTPTDIFLIGEFAAGGELFEYIVNKGTVMPEKDTRRFFQQIVCGVRYCHERGVVHRDLKPENLLLDANNDIKIADFGLSNALNDGALLATSCGSPNYAAPEVIQGKHYIGPEIDVWSCGVILYVMLAGRLPFDAPSVPQLFKLIERGVYNVPSYVSEGAKKVLSRMLTVDTMMRASLEEICSDPWFMTSLPDYLLEQLTHRKESSIGTHMDDPNLISKLQSLADHRHESIDKLATSFANHEIDLERSLAGIAVKQPKSRTASHSQSSDSDMLGDASMSPQFTGRATKPVRPCLIEGQRYCRDDCNMCPKWGAARCLFAHRIKSLNQCDLCPDNRRKGCLFSTEKLTMEDLFRPQGDQANQDQLNVNFVIGTSHNAVMSAHGHTAVPVINSVFSHPVQRQIQEMLKTRKRAAAKWHLGIRSNSAPAQIMQSLYKMLQALNYSWHRLTPNHLLIKLINDQFQNSVLLSMQLFRLKGNSYLIDFRNLAPPDAHQEDIEQDIHVQSITGSPLRSPNNERSPKRMRHRALTFSGQVLATDHLVKKALGREVVLTAHTTHKTTDNLMEITAGQHEATPPPPMVFSDGSLKSAATDTDMAMMDLPGAVPQSPTLKTKNENHESMDWDAIQQAPVGSSGGNLAQQASRSNKASSATLTGQASMDSKESNPRGLSLERMLEIFGDALFDEEEAEMEMDVAEGEVARPICHGTDLLPSHTLRYLDSCAIMVSQMMKG